MNSNQILVLGIGNLLMGDEGIGIHIVRELEKESFPESILLLDGGVGGFHLLEYLQNAKKIIIIDAAKDNAPLGTVKKIIPKYSSDYPRTLTAHDIGLKDLLDTFYLTGKELPEINLYTISIEELPGILTVKLSEKLQNKFKEIYDYLKKEIYQILDELKTNSVN
ncbi:MAG: hydrogenase maturation protease [Leptonema sp. (in: bacteria)]